VRKEGEWRFFKDFEGDEGWIHKSLLGKTQTVVTKRDKCNIRSGPGTRFDVLFTVEKGVPFKVLKSDPDWLQVEHADGDQGWIHRGLVW
jgi:SH3-like domain-containing protein